MNTSAREQAKEAAAMHLLLAAAGGAAGVGLVAGGYNILNPSDPLAQLNAGKVWHQGYDTQHGWAERFAQSDQAKVLSDVDYAMAEGIRQGMMGGKITSREVDEMVLSGQVSPTTAFVLQDIYDEGAATYGDPRWETVRPLIAEAREAYLTERGIPV